MPWTTGWCFGLDSASSAQRRWGHHPGAAGRTARERPLDPAAETYEWRRIEASRRVVPRGARRTARLVPSLETTKEAPDEPVPPGPAAGRPARDGARDPGVLGRRRRLHQVPRADRGRSAVD